MFRYAGRSVARSYPRVLQQQQQRRCFAAIATAGGGSDTTKRRPRPLHRAAALLPRSSGSCVPLSSSVPVVHAHHALGSIRVGGHGFLNTRELSTRRGLPPRLSVPEKIFAGLVVAVLAAWGLVFGAITLLLLPFVGIGLFLLRRNFQRGGISRNLAPGLARRMAEREGGIGGVPWAQGGSEGALATLLASMLGGMGGMELVGVMRSEVEKRALRHPGLSSALGGGFEAFSDVGVSTAGAIGGRRVTQARLRFSGKRAGPGGAGWAEVEVTEEEGGSGAEEGGMEFDRIFVTLDDGRSFDLTSDSFADDGNVEEGGTAQFLRGGRQHSSGGGKRGTRKGRRAAGDGRGGGRPVEAEFRDK